MKFPDYYSYFINNQFNNNKKAFELALNYEKNNNISYDLFIRLRIDKTVFPNPVLLDHNMRLPIVTHVEPCQFFFIGNKEMMKYYCDFTYLENYSYDENVRVPDPPREILKHITKKFTINIIRNILTIYSENRTNKIGEFPFIDKNEEDEVWNWNCTKPK